ncbi:MULTISPECIES: succinate dehydrogenase, hydrophobic membrane anchor protein [unclassified Caulobacter]|uniref:succinate dehydrogenase, hydrophobic membrane anchor protein n=1 Tax=unclassified Caulobacter TaxID=2648921 RepID=UPI0004A73936|nr:succinate dehydrogenase, hydrophobic membrane anchor protein [Caulobacter sp. UNC358MFTsu5.1]
MAKSSSARFRTPMSRARGLGASHHGVGHFVTERVSGIALIPLALWGVFAALRLAGLGFDGAAEWVAIPHNTVLLSLLIVVALVHLKGAVQVVIEDYVPDFTTKTVLVLANLFVCVLGGALGVVAILKVAFTGAL